MSDPEQVGTNDPQDDAEIEVSDLRSGARDTAPSSPPSHPRSPFEQRYTRRQRLVRGAVGVLALLIVVNGITGVGGRMLGLLARPAPTATFGFPPASGPYFSSTALPAAPPVPPAANAFYLLPNPPGVTVSLDGRPLASLPLPGDSHPLQVSPGHHVFAWTSSLFPFQPLRCTISAPHMEGDTCPFVSAQDLPADQADLAGHVIAMHDALNTLPASEVPRLTQALQGALANISETILQPGEHYFYYQQGENGSPVAATQQVRAALSYDYSPIAGYFEPCILTQPAIPCRFPGQDCNQICTVPQPPVAVVTAPNDWIAAVNAEASWSYAMLDGKAIARNLGEAFGLQLAIVRISWDGGSWGVTLIAGETPGLSAADDLACDPARFWLGQNDTWSFMMDNPPPGARTQFISDGIPTDGCLALLNPYPRSGPSAVFLEHCGVLLAVNTTAENGGSAGLPMASAAELQLARQLAAQAGVTIS